MLTFNHSGKMGDLLYSLYFCNSVIEAQNEKKFNFNIQINVPQSLHGREEGKGRLTEENAKYIASFLWNQPYINKLTITDKFDPKNYQRGFNLDNFRTLRINFSAGHIPEWYYNLTNFPLKRHYEQPLLTIEPNTMFAGKIIVLQTKKYINPFVDLSVLSKYKDRLVFIGLEEEYELIKKKIPDIPYFKVSSGLEVAQAIKGATLTISNQNGNFAIAQLMKANRILIPAQYELVGKQKKSLQNGPTNVICHGGWFQNVNTTDKLDKLLGMIFK